MKKFNYIFLMLTLFCVSISFGQNLGKHRWKQRVLIITSKSTAPLQKQIDSLTKNIKGLQERKLAIYQVTPEGYAKGTGKNNWTKTTNFYKKIKGSSGYELRVTRFGIRASDCEVYLTVCTYGGKPAINPIV